MEEKQVTHCREQVLIYRNLSMVSWLPSPSMNMPLIKQKWDSKRESRVCPRIHWLLCNLILSQLFKRWVKESLGAKWGCFPFLPTLEVSKHIFLCCKIYSNNLNYTIISSCMLDYVTSDLEYLLRNPKLQTIYNIKFICTSNA
jgi:hypothetical protein